MKFLEETTSDLMHATFLRAEFWGENNFVRVREGIKRGLPYYTSITHGMSYSEIEGIIENPDITNDLHNSIRKGILRIVRWKLIDTIPPSTRWYKAILDGNDLRELLIINCLEWAKMYGIGIRNLREIVDTIVNNPKNGRPDLLAEFKRLLKYKNCDFDKTLILIGSSWNGPFTIIEGNHRAVTLYYRYVKLNPDVEYPSHEVLVGIHKSKETYLFE